MKVLKQVPVYLLARAMIAKCYLLLKDHDKAFDILIEVLAADPKVRIYPMQFFLKTLHFS